MNVKILLTAFFFSISSWGADKPIPVQVGGYEFPPFVMNTGSGFKGLSLDLIQLLNQKQNKYVFTFVPTSATRRYHDMKTGRYQIILFESKSWGWSLEIVDVSKVFHKSGEVYIANKRKAKDQTYFNELKGKSIKGIQGYHYGFLGLSTSNKALKDFNVEFTNTIDGNIRSVVLNRADIALVAREYLNFYFQKYPEDRSKILISDKYDQNYELSILLAKGQNVIRLEEINQLIDTVTNDGSLAALFKQKKIEPKKL